MNPWQQLWSVIHERERRDDGKYEGFMKQRKDGMETMLFTRGARGAGVLAAYEPLTYMFFPKSALIYPAILGCGVLTRYMKNDSTAIQAYLVGYN